MLDPGRIATNSYSGFISYCRRDAAHARWLQQALESYRLPSRLVGTPTPHGPVPSRLAPIFLDRSDLTVAPDLEGELAQAIRSSRYLIVLCTPNSARSEWVTREIGMMQQAGRADQILTALFEGDEHDAFPTALRDGGDVGAVPLAADFRPSGDGRRLALLKLVAVLAGVSLGELVHRDETRRRRQLSSIAAGAVAGMALLGAISLYALDAKAEAEAERRKSEALVSALVTDLRSSVKPLGSLAILGQINEAAGRYFRGQSLESMPDSTLAQRAKLLIAMGEDDAARGALDTALTHFAEAARTTAARLAVNPNDPARIHDHAQSEYWLGYHAWNSGRPTDAVRAWQAYLSLALRLKELEPQNLDWRLEAAYAESNLGVLDLRQSLALTSAEGRFQRALADYREVLRQRPGDSQLQLDLADGLAWLADTQRLSGRPTDARRTRLEQRRLLEAAVTAGAADLGYRRELVANRIALGRIADEERDVRAARAQYAAARAEADRLLALDPENVQLAGRRRMAELMEARALLRGGASAPEAEALLPAECANGRLPAELADWCLLVRARLALAQGRFASVGPLLAAVAKRQDQPDQPRLSARFGLDFRTELQELERLALARRGMMGKGRT